MQKHVRPTILHRNEAESFLSIEGFDGSLSSAHAFRSSKGAKRVCGARLLFHSGPTLDVFGLHLAWFGFAGLQVKRQHIACGWLVPINAVLDVDEDVCSCATIDETEAIRTIEGLYGARGAHDNTAWRLCDMYVELISKLKPHP